MSANDGENAANAENADDDMQLDPELEAELSALLANSSMWQSPPPSLEHRVVGAVADEVTRVRGTSDAAPAAPHDSVERPARRAKKSSWMTKPLAIAAAFVFAIGAAVVLRQSPSKTANTVTFALAGTDLAPGAVGSVKVTPTDSGLRIELDATGLPRRDGVQFYQAWLKGESGLVPVGTFHTGEQVTLWAGVALADFPTLTVTQEEVGDQASSGKKVMVGSSVPGGAAPPSSSPTSSP